MRTKVACYGSCITRDNFNSKLNPNYKDRYQCVATSEHSSIISLVTPKVQYEDHKLDFQLSEFSHRNKEIAKNDLDKSFLNELIQNQPDYLIMDFFPDVYFGTVYSEDNIMTNNDWYLCNTTFYKELPNKFVLKIERDLSKYLSVWIPALDIFINFVKTAVPHCQIIINKARFSNRLLDNQTISYLPPITMYNEIWGILDNHAISKYKLKYIELDHSKYYLTKKPTLGWKIFYLHYHDNYYHDFLSEFDNLQ